MGPELIPLALAAGGTVMQASAQQDAADEKRSILNRQMERDDAATDKANQLVNTEGQNYGMDERTKQLATNESKIYDQTQSDLASAGAGGTLNTSGDAGNVSADFLKNKASRSIDEGTRLTSIARAAAKSRSAGGLMNDDALRRAGMASNLQNVWGTASNMDKATRADAENVQAPAYGALGSIASAIGNTMGQGAAKGLASRIKYAGSSNNPLAANYENSLDSGIQW